jgi:hypothetical protein
VKRAIGKSRVVSPTALLVLTACIIAALLFAAGVTSGSAEAATGQHPLTVYSVVTTAQFVNHKDDRQRGLGHNPFLADTAKLAPKNIGNGPFAGDVTLYAFTLYGNANLTHKIGTAVYTCTYNFTKNALCEASFDLSGGSLLASGPVHFANTSFTLAISGGTNKYFAANGQVAMSQVTKNEQRFKFLFS